MCPNEEFLVFIYTMPLTFYNALTVMMRYFINWSSAIAAGCFWRSCGLRGWIGRVSAAAHTFINASFIAGTFLEWVNVNSRAPHLSIFPHHFICSFDLYIKSIQMYHWEICDITRGKDALMVVLLCNSSLVSLDIILYIIYASFHHLTAGVLFGFNAPRMISHIQ